MFNISHEIDVKLIYKESKMKKRIVVTVLVVSLVSVGVFAGSMNYNKTRGIASEQSQMNSSLYVSVDNNSYRNVETNEIVTRDNLPENCRLGDQGRDNHNRRANNNSPQKGNRAKNHQRLDTSQNMREDGTRPYFQNNGLNSSN
jgi:hypothetical protein